MNYIDLLNFEMSVQDIVINAQPESTHEYERISDLLHQHIEVAIHDCLESDGNIDVEDYDPNY